MEEGGEHSNMMPHMHIWGAQAGDREDRGGVMFFLVLVVAMQSTPTYYSYDLMIKGLNIFLQFREKICATIISIKKPIDLAS